MFTKLKTALIEYVKENVVILVICIILFASGIITGSIMSFTLSSEISNSLFEYLQGFLELMKNQNNIESYDLFVSSLSQNLTLIGIIWVLGVTIIGILLIFAIVFMNGFIFGFTITFLTNKMAFSGFCFSLLAVLPHNIFFIPVFILISTAAVSFSILLLRNHLVPKGINLSVELINYMVIIVFTTTVTFFASLVEAYITPTFMNLLVNYV